MNDNALLKEEIQPDRRYTSEQVSGILNRSLSTLAKWRMNRRHLSFISTGRGGRVLYTGKSLLDFLQRNEVKSI